MAKKQKKTYDAYLREQLGSLIDQLQLPDLYKQSLKERWLDQMIWADKKADQCRRWHYRLRLTAIIGGVILPALVGISVQLGQDSKFFRVWFPPLTFTLSQIIAISVAIEEFCKYGDRWRDYRKLAEDLKSEGWQYLQSCGPYELGASAPPVPTPLAVAGRSGNGMTSSLSWPTNGLSQPTAATRRSHLENYAQFANRIESLIKDDVQSYISDLMQQQAKQDAEVQKILAQAQAVTSDKTLIAQLNPNYGNPADSLVASASNGSPTNGGAATLGLTEIVGGLKVLRDTEFKLSTQPSQTLPENQRVRVGSGSTFSVLAYNFADNNHFHVTFNQGLGVENRNTWFTYAPHVELTGKNGQPISYPANTPASSAAPGLPTPTPAAPAFTPAAPTVSSGSVQLAVPYLSQLDNVQNPFGSCNVTSIAMCLTYLGAKQNNPQKQFEDELQDWLEAHSLDRHEPAALAKAVEAYGCQDNFTTNATLDQVKQWLAQGNPAVTHGYFTQSGHIVCLIGYNDKGLIVHDPYGEWQEGGYARNDDGNQQRGKGLTYSYGMIQRTCMTDGQFWVHFISRPGVRPNVPQPAAATVPTPAPAAPTVGQTQTKQWITADQLVTIAGSGGNADRIRQFTPAVNQAFEKYQITTPLRIAHFLAQVMHESGGFQYVRELWGPSRDQLGYEGCSDLGNTQPGDGERFMGRGLIQLTGRTNYTDFSSAIGVDCVTHPELVEQAPYAVMAAGWFWDKNKLNPDADRDDIVTVTKVVNGGDYGLEERRAYLQAAKLVLGIA